MNKKFIGVVYASMAMISVGIMVIVGMVSGSWDNLWLFPFGAMILATIFAMVVGVINEDKEKKGKK